jgi:hypothetical protein
LVILTNNNKTMKRKLYTLVAAVVLGTLFSCEPIEDRNSLPEMTYTEATLHHTEVVTDNTLLLTNNDKDVVAYWTVTDATGANFGHFNGNSTPVTIPFKGTYTVTYTGYTRAGAVFTSPKTITVLKTDLSSITTDPKWAILANGAAGKTWVLDMSGPVGWAGLDYPAKSGDNWAWLPAITDISWAGFEIKDWGEMRFDLNEAYNVSVTQTAYVGTSQTTKAGTFAFDIANDKITFDGGVEVLHGGNYYEDVSNWTTVHVIELTETSMRLGVIRDQSRSGEGKCQIVFHYKPKP